MRQLKAASEQSESTFEMLSKPPRVYLSNAAVRRRYSITDSTFHRWRNNPTMGFPKPKMSIGQTSYWLPEDLDAFDDNRANKPDRYQVKAADHVQE